VKKYLWTLAKYGIGLVVLAVVLWMNWKPADGSMGLADALDRPIQVWAVAATVAVCLIGLLLTFCRWYVLVRAQELPFTVGESIRLGFVGFALSTFLPGSIGGDIIKAACLARQQNRRTVAVATVLFDRFIGLCGLFWLVAILGGLFWASGTLDQLVPKKEHQAVLLFIIGASWVLAIGSLLFWFVMGMVPRSQVEPWAVWLSNFPRAGSKIGGSLAEFWRAGWMYRSKGRSVLMALGLSLIGHVGFVLTFYFAALAICPPETIPPVGSHFVIIPVGLTFEAGFPTPGGVGGAEAVFGFLYNMLGFASANGVAGSFIKRVVAWGLGLVGYIVYLRMKPALQAAVEGEAKEVSQAEPLAMAEA
jgi:uncharacterized protein (TIRG00374 family)